MNSALNPIRAGRSKITDLILAGSLALLAVWAWTCPAFGQANTTLRSALAASDTRLFAVLGVCTSVAILVTLRIHRRLLTRLMRRHMPALLEAPHALTDALLALGVGLAVAAVGGNHGEAILAAELLISVGKLIASSPILGGLLFFGPLLAHVVTKARRRVRGQSWPARSRAVFMTVFLAAIVLR